MSPDVLTISTRDEIAHVTLARPDVRNAFNADLIAKLAVTFERLGRDPDVRAIVLRGEGKTFCGGADIGWMRGSLDLSRPENLADAKKMSEMFRTIDRTPKPVIAAIQGAALGGGAGLAAVCDIVICAGDAVFGFTEVKLGIIPAVISPFVLSKIGVSNARALFLTGQRFDAERARAIGLVHEVVAQDDLDAAVGRIITEIRSAGPGAIAAAKRLVERMRETPYDGSRDITAEAIAEQRTTPEGQEGLRAFLERRPPHWNP